MGRVGKDLPHSGITETEREYDEEDGHSARNGMLQAQPNHFGAIPREP